MLHTHTHTHFHTKHTQTTQGPRSEMQHKEKVLIEKAEINRTPGWKEEKARDGGGCGVDS